MPSFGPKSWNIYQYFSRNLKILTRCIKYISPPLDTKNTFKTWRSGATHIKPWSPSCCVLSCLTVLALLWHSMLGQVNPCTPGSVRHGYPSVSVIFGLEESRRPMDSRLYVRPYVRIFWEIRASDFSVFSHEAVAP